MKNHQFNFGGKSENQIELSTEENQALEKKAELEEQLEVFIKPGGQLFTQLDKLEEEKASEVKPDEPEKNEAGQAKQKGETDQEALKLRDAAAPTSTSNDDRSTTTQSSASNPPDSHSEAHTHRTKAGGDGSMISSPSKQLQPQLQGNENSGGQTEAATSKGGSVGDPAKLEASLIYHEKDVNRHWTEDPTKSQNAAKHVQDSPPKAEDQVSLPPAEPLPQLPNKCFKVEKSLGEGSFGSVYEVSYGGEKYALKLVKQGDSKKNMGIKREMEVQKNLNSSQIPELVATAENNEYFGLLMELCSKGDLLDLYYKEGFWGHEYKVLYLYFPRL